MENTAGNGCPQPDRSNYEPLQQSVTRRQVFKFAAAGLAALGLSAQSEVALAASKRVKAGRVKSIPVRGVKAYTLNGQYIIITQPRKGTFKAFSGSCTHQGVRMRSVSGSNVVCTAHGSTFSATTGKVTKGPATSALKTYRTSVKKGFVYVTV
jgi:nitrite reductase/ring-hydroxylating ferredoxin subunit